MVSDLMLIFCFASSTSGLCEVKLLKFLKSQKKASISLKLNGTAKHLQFYISI